MNSTLIKSSIWYTIGNVLPQIITFILLPLYTHYLGPKEYGIVNAINALNFILIIFMSFGIDRSLYRLYHDYDNFHKKKFIGNSILIITISALCVVLIIFLVRKYIVYVYNNIPFTPYYFLGIIYSFITVFTLIPKVYYQVENKVLKFVVITFFQFFIMTTLILYLVIHKKEGAEGYLIAQLISVLITIPYLFFDMKKYVSFEIDRRIIKSIIKYSFPLIPILLSGWVLSLIDRIFISYMSTLDQLGIYSLSYKIASIVLITSNGINIAYNAFFFKFVNEETSDVRKIKYYNDIYISIIFAISFVISINAKNIMYLFDEKFSYGAMIIPLLCFSYFFNMLAGITYKMFYQNKNTLSVMYINLLGSIVNIILDFILIKNYGIYGASFATLVSYIIIFIASYSLSKKEFHIEIDIAYIMILFVMSLIYISCLLYFVNNKALLVVIGVISSIIMGFFLFKSLKRRISYI